MYHEHSGFSCKSLKHYISVYASLQTALKGFTEIYFNFEVLLVNYSKSDEIGELLAALASFRDDINDTEP